MITRLMEVRVLQDKNFHIHIYVQNATLLYYLKNDLSFQLLQESTLEIHFVLSRECQVEWKLL